MQNEIEATIQPDKLTLCCTSAMENNFNYQIISDPKEVFKHTFFFGNVTLFPSNDYYRNRGYKYCYEVLYGKDHILIGEIKFGLWGQPHHDDKIWFSIQIKNFYNNTYLFLPSIFEELNLTLHNVTRLHIALDNYKINYDVNIRKNLKNKENKIKLFGRYIKDRKKLEKRIRYWNCGSLDNQFMVRTLYFKNKKQVNYSKNKKHNPEDEENTKDAKTTIEFTAYDKLEEINDFSPHKTYILDYHKEHNPKYKHIYREEIRLESEELRRLEKKRKKPITLTDLLSKEFLYEVFTEYIDRIIVIRDNKGNKIGLFPKPYLGDCKGKLPLTLPPGPDDLQLIENKEIPIIENENLFFNNKEDLQEDFEEIIYNNPIYFEYYENNKKIIRPYKTKNKQCFKRHRKSKLWTSIKPYPSKQNKNRNVKLLENY